MLKGDPSRLTRSRSGDGEGEGEGERVQVRCVTRYFEESRAPSPSLRFVMSSLVPASVIDVFRAAAAAAARVRVRNYF